MSRQTALKKLREILTLRHQALRQALVGDDSLLHELQQNSGGDVVDFACDSANGELSSQLAEVEHRELAAIENALQKMKDGTYGQCDACNRNIPLARLEALPYAAHCIDCKRAAEIAGIEPAKVVDWSIILDGSSHPMSDTNFRLS